MGLLAAIGLSGCAGGPQSPASELPSLPAVGAIPPATLDQQAHVATAEPAGVSIEHPVGSATELYSRIAQGAMACWFATGGPLKRDYIFNATADAPSRGGKARITIHRRDPTQPNPRGMKMFVVDIQPTGETSAAIKAENLNMSAAFAASMTDDVARWSKGEQGCVGASTAAGWAPAPPEIADAATKSKPKKSKNKKLKAKEAEAAAR
jgi:hypothetical protein